MGKIPSLPSLYSWQFRLHRAYGPPPPRRVPAKFSFAIHYPWRCMWRHCYVPSFIDSRKERLGTQECWCRLGVLYRQVTDETRIGVSGGPQTIWRASSANGCRAEEGIARNAVEEKKREREWHWLYTSTSSPAWTVHRGIARRPAEARASRFRECDWEPSKIG
jgi:hypothetical protein